MITLLHLLVYNYEIRKYSIPIPLPELRVLITHINI